MENQVYLSANLRYLRRERGLTQAALADALGMKRGILGAYEEGRAEPKLETLMAMASFFGVSLDALVGRTVVPVGGHSMANGPRVLAVVTDPAGKERATLVPLKAAAGYLRGYGDVEYVERLPSFDLPFPELPQDRTYRVFQVQGDSMLPIAQGSYVIGEYVADPLAVKAGTMCVLLSHSDGVVLKRLRWLAGKDEVQLESDNAAYAPYRVPAGELLEVWRVRGVLSFDPDGRSAAVADTHALMDSLRRIEAKVDALGKK